MAEVGRAMRFINIALVLWLIITMALILLLVHLTQGHLSTTNDEEG